MLSNAAHQSRAAFESGLGLAFAMVQVARRRSASGFAFALCLSRLAPSFSSSRWAARALEHLLQGERLILPVRRLSPAGLEAWKDVLRAGYEGLVAKDPASPYVGGRTLKWLKVR